MKQSRYSEEQIVGILKEAEAGISVAELCTDNGQLLLLLPFSSLSSLTSFLPPIDLPIEDIFKDFLYRFLI